MAVMETEHGAIFAQLYTETESLKRRLVDATSQITTVLAEKTDLVTRIASTLEDDMARILRVKEAALEEARSTIAALEKAGGCDALSTKRTNDSTSNIRKVSLEETEQPILDILRRGEEMHHLLPSPMSRSHYDAII